MKTKPKHPDGTIGMIGCLPQTIICEGKNFVLQPIFEASKLDDKNSNKNLVRLFIKLCRNNSK